MARVAIRNKLVEYFKEKGSILSEAEYAAAEDKPYSVMLVKRSLGTWSNVTRKVTPFLVKQEPVVIPDTPEEPNEDEDE